MSEIKTDLFPAVLRAGKREKDASEEAAVTSQRNMAVFEKPLSEPAEPGKDKTRGE